MESKYFYYLGAPAKFGNPTITPSGRKVSRAERKRERRHLVLCSARKPLGPMTKNQTVEERKRKLRQVLGRPVRNVVREVYKLVNIEKRVKEQK